MRNAPGDSLEDGTISGLNLISRFDQYRFGPNRKMKVVWRHLEMSCVSSDGVLYCVPRETNLDLAQYCMFKATSPR